MHTVSDVNVTLQDTDGWDTFAAAGSMPALFFLQSVRSMVRTRVLYTCNWGSSPRLTTQCVCITMVMKLKNQYSIGALNSEMR